MRLTEGAIGSDVDIKELEHQHARLVGYVNELGSALRSGQGRAMVGGILVSLHRSLRTHVAAEDRLMGQCSHPERCVERHRSRTLVEQLSRLIVLLGTGKLSVDDTIVEFLRSSLSEHIGACNDRGAGTLAAVAAAV